MNDVVADEPCSVSFEPSELTFVEVARLIFRLRMPRAGRPILRYAMIMAYLAFAFGFVGYQISSNLFRPGVVSPSKFALFCSMPVLLFPLRMYAAIAVTRTLLSRRGTSSFEVAPAGLTRRTDNRVTWHAWAGVVDVRLTSHDVVFLFDIGDFALIPRRAFADREHEARFLKLAGMVSDRLWLRPPDRAINA